MICAVWDWVIFISLIGLITIQKRKGLNESPKCNRKRSSPSLPSTSWVKLVVAQGGQYIAMTAECIHEGQSRMGFFVIDSAHREPSVINLHDQQGIITLVGYL